MDGPDQPTGKQGHGQTWTKAASYLAWVFIGVLFVGVLWETVRAGIKCSAADNLDRGRMTNQPAHDAAWRESSWHLAWVFIGVLLFGVPWYLRGEFVFRSGSPAYVVFSIVFYILGVVCVAFGVWAFLRHQAKRVLAKNDDLRIREVLPLSLKTGDEGWHNVFGAVTYVTIALAVHLVATNTFLQLSNLFVSDELSNLFVSILKVVVLFFGALAVVHAAHAVAYFVSRYLLNRSSGDPEADRGQGRRDIRKVATAVVSILGTLAALATIVDVFGS